MRRLETRCTIAQALCSAGIITLVILCFAQRKSEQVGTARGSPLIVNVCVPSLIQFRLIYCLIVALIFAPFI